jgi:hypothetical protein
VKARGRQPVKKHLAAGFTPSPAVQARSSFLFLNRGRGATTLHNDYIIVARVPWTGSCLRSDPISSFPFLSPLLMPPPVRP